MVAVGVVCGDAAELREELDLRIEAQNMTAVAAAARDEDLRVPAPYQAYCGERVLVMQYLEGRPLLTAAPGLPAESQADSPTMGSRYRRRSQRCSAR